MTRDRPRVLVLVWRLSRGGGIPRVVRQLIERIDIDVVELHVCSVRPLLAEDQIPDRHGVRLHSLDILGMRSPRRVVQSFLRARRVIRAVAPDVVHSQSGTPWAVLPCVLPGSRVRGRLLEIQDAPQSRRSSRASTAVEGFMIRRLGFTPLVHSSSVEADVRRAHRLRGAAVVRFALGIDSAELALPSEPRAAVRARLAVAADEQIILWVARLAPSKRPRLFVEAAALIGLRVPSARFVIAGTGSELDALQDAVARSSVADRIQVLGFVPDLVSLYNAADVFVSTSEYEGFGLALAEAAAVGVPSVAIKVGGVVDVVDDGVTGTLVPAESGAGALADAVADLLLAPGRLQEMGTAARRRAVEVLDVRQAVANVQDLYVTLARADDERSP